MSKIKLQGNASGTGTTTVQSANTSSNQTFTIPGTDGTAGQFLSTDGSGNLSFANLRWCIRYTIDRYVNKLYRLTSKHRYLRISC